MAKVKDLTGWRFGHLTVVSYAGSDKGNGALWLCNCDCGSSTIKSSKMLIHNGKYASCGCYDGRSKRLIDLTGQHFGSLTVLHRVENRRGQKTLWLCQCDCGNQKIVASNHLKSGEVKSCGCRAYVNKPLILRRTHNNRLYNIWSGMHYRCENKNASSFEYYGGRGIKVCDTWSGENGFENFAEWAIKNGYGDTLEIDRVDNDAGYSECNCRWVDHQNNAFNRRAKNSSGISGVVFRQSRTGVGGNWRVSITVNSKTINLGTFQTLEEAKEARKQAELKYWGFTKIE